MKITKVTFTPEPSSSYCEVVATFEDGTKEVTYLDNFSANQIVKRSLSEGSKQQG